MFYLKFAPSQDRTAPARLEVTRNARSKGSEGLGKLFRNSP